MGWEGMGWGKGRVLMKWNETNTTKGWKVARFLWGERGGLEGDVFFGGGGVLGCDGLCTYIRGGCELCNMFVTQLSPQKELINLKKV